MTRYKVIGDITKLTIDSGVAPYSTTTAVIDWYTWAYDNNHVTYIYDNDDLIGYMDWVRLHRVPTDLQDLQVVFGESSQINGTVVMVLNCVVVKGKDTLRKLIRMTRKQCGECRITCWHNRKTDRIVQFCWRPKDKYTQGGCYATELRSAGL
jgi:hypothetical protein